MNKNLVIVGGVIILIILIAIAFTAGQHSSDDEDYNVSPYGELSPGAAVPNVVDDSTAPTSPAVLDTNTAAPSQPAVVEPGAPPAVTQPTVLPQDTQPAVLPSSPPPVTNNQTNSNNAARTGEVTVIEDSVIIAPYSSNVYINGHELTESEMSEFASTYGSQPQPGNYWYDSTSGAYGYVGQPTYSVMYAGHNYGYLSANASNGDSGVYINGRHLPYAEAVLVAALFGSQPIPGNYSLDASGNFYSDTLGFLGNLYLLAVQSGSSSGGGGGGGGNFWSSGVYSAGNYNAGNTQGYVSVPGVGPVGYGF